LLASFPSKKQSAEGVFRKPRRGAAFTFFDDDVDAALSRRLAILREWRWAIEQGMLLTNGDYRSEDRHVFFRAASLLGLASDLDGFNKPVLAIIAADRDMRARYGHTRHRKQVLMSYLFKRSEDLGPRPSATATFSRRARG
jgi:hypothetical protein